MIKMMFYIKHQQLLCTHELLVDEIKPKKNKLIQKYLKYGGGKQSIMP
jgi:hypothetical protein